MQAIVFNRQCVCPSTDNNSIIISSHKAMDSTEVQDTINSHILFNKMFFKQNFFYLLEDCTMYLQNVVFSSGAPFQYNGTVHS